MPSPSPLTSRKLDLFYLIFFTTHIPVVLLIDTIPLYPRAYIPSISTHLRSYYITTYRDRFFTHPPTYFTFYITLELIYHVPISLWMLRALSIEHPLVPLHLLLFATQTAITTATCLVDMLNWEGYSTAELGRLCALYVPYLVIAIIMGVDAFLRLKRILLAKTKQS